ncbi:MAG: septal ring lytic transglycosylase RlpA family protein [Gammaproteobacteria bacterium]|jgi:rare lipoprotein A|nr:septal ring lytic transglycosylase RlpA family protein [Gammaproteobacteria bacterium]
MHQHLRVFSLVGLIGSLAACSAVAPPTPIPPSSSSRYSIDQDRAPSRNVDLESIPNVVAEPIRRTMAGNRSPYSVLGKTYQVLPTEEGYRERGVASWYGEKFHGHKTSNGEVFDMYQVSAAHKSLPIPSFLQVTNLDNNRSIVVRVNDRGPFHGDRIVDLSYAAALKLGYADRGTARVELEAIIANGSDSDRSGTRNRIVNLETGNRAISGEKYLQVGAFSDVNIAREVSEKLRVMTKRPVIISTINNTANGVLHRVRIGPVNDPGEIRRITQSVVAASLGSPYTITE